MYPRAYRFVAVIFCVMFCAVLAEAYTVIRSVNYRLYFGVETPEPVLLGSSCFTDGCIGWPLMSHLLHPETVNVFHTDVDVTYDGCPPGGVGWDVFISHDFPTLDHRVELDQALLYVNQFARLTLPVSGFEFTGVDVGEDLWILPQNNPGNILYFGIASPISSQIQNTYLATWTPPGLVPAKWIAWQLRSVAHDAEDDSTFDDDGVFSVWQSSGSGQITLFMSSYDDHIAGNGAFSDGITDSDVFYDAAGGHTHMNWGFSAPGIYRIEFQAETVINVELPTPRFDIGWDADVDLADYAEFQRCIGNEDEPYPCGCEWADSDLDGAVTVLDFSDMLQCWSAPDAPVNPNCSD